MSSQGWQLTLKFRKAADLFELIPGTTYPIIVPWGDEGKALCEEIRRRHRLGIPLSRVHYRAAQAFLVQIYEHEWRELTATGQVESLHEGAAHLLVHPENDYHPAFGLKSSRAADDPRAFQV